MKRPINYVVIAAAISGISKSANAMTVKVSDLPSLGIDQDEVINQFSSKYSLKLELADLIEVQRENEGTHLRMEAADHMVILVPIFSAHGPYNKDWE